MDIIDFEKEIKKMIEEFGEASFQKAVMINRKPQILTATLREELDYLRLCIKYNIFDLESARRENEFLTKLLRENNSPNF